MLYNKSLLSENKYNLQRWRKMSNWIKNLIKKNNQKKGKNEQKDKIIKYIASGVIVFAATICTVIAFKSDGNDASFIIALFTSILTISCEIMAWRKFERLKGIHLTPRKLGVRYLLDNYIKTEWNLIIIFLCLANLIYMITNKMWNMKFIDSHIPNIITMIVTLIYLGSNIFRNKKGS